MLKRIKEILNAEKRLKRIKNKSLIVTYNGNVFTALTFEELSNILDIKGQHFYQINIDTEKETICILDSLDVIAHPNA